LIILQILSKKFEVPSSSTKSTYRNIETFQAINDQTNITMSTSSTYVTPIKVEDETYLKNFKTNILKYLKCDESIFAGLSEILVKYSAVIAGGSVLDGAFLNIPKIKDLDIYVPNQNIKNFINDLRKLFKIDYMDIRKNSGYCDSFLKKNKIRKIYTLKQMIDYGAIAFDIMAVRRCRTPLDVVSNFDLTVCQVLYNGKDIMATHLQHVLDKQANIKPDYFATLLQGNCFLRERMNKYIKKGFKINFPTLSTPLKDNTTNDDVPFKSYPLNECSLKALDNWFKSLVVAVACDNLDYRYPNTLSYDKQNELHKARNCKFSTELPFENDDGYETDECSTPEETLFFLKKKGMTIDDLSKKFEESIHLKKVLTHASDFKNKIKSGILELLVEEAKQLNTFQTA